MIKTFEDMIELMHTYWGEGDEVHKDLDTLLELHKKEVADICKNCENYGYYKNGYKDGQKNLKKEYEDLIIGLTKEEVRRIRQNAIEEIENIFDYDYFLKYSNDDRLISFNNLSLMLKDMLEQLKEK